MDLTLKGYSPKTQKTYSNNVSDLPKQFAKYPELLTTAIVSSEFS
ncbi:hypothetical protein [Serpentinicella alkaliphila]|nr:hypothetical protein [Serpentinicella alkaliphila]